MKVKFGKIHKYLGMTLDFGKRGKVKVSMLDYVKEVLSAWDLVKNQQDADDFDIVLFKKKVRNTAAPDNLFKVDETSEKLNKECSKAFHHIVAKALSIKK